MQPRKSSLASQSGSIEERSEHEIDGEASTGSENGGGRSRAMGARSSLQADQEIRDPWAEYQQLHNIPQCLLKQFAAIFNGSTNEESPRSGDND